MSERVVVVVGPTASGKSDVAMAVASASPTVEIVAVDAMQVYRGMDIGTAKPGAADRQAVPHHCLDLVDAGQLFTVADYQREARSALAAIADRGHVALLVAGTGLYLTAVIDDLNLPGEWPAIRAEVELEPDNRALHQRLAVLDPAAAVKIDPLNRRRIIRAIEVCVGSGKPFSGFGPGTGSYPAIETPQIGLRWPRPLLGERIDARVRDMIDNGLLDEVRGLLANPQGLSRTARQALGYKELIAHLQGRCSLDAAVAAIMLRTRQFAVRQERWFRRDPRIRWIDIAGDPAAEVATFVQQHLA